MTTQSPEIEPLFHGSDRSFDKFELQKDPTNGVGLGFGIYLTNHEEIAKRYAPDGGTIYKVDPSVIEGKAVSAASLTLSHETVTRMISSIAKDEIEEDDYPYILSEGGDEPHEDWDNYNASIASKMAASFLEYEANDVDVINQIYQVIGREPEVAPRLLKALKAENITHARRTIAGGDSAQPSLEYIVFNPENIKILSKETNKVQADHDLQSIIKNKDYAALSEHLKNGVKDYLKSDVFKNFLNFISNFHQYSQKNVRLILAQNPEAKYVASYKKWSDELDNPVKKGGKATYIYAPNPVIKRDEQRRPIVDENGEVVKVIHYKLVPVFADNQTINPEKLPQPVYDLSKDLDDPKAFIQLYRSLEAIAPVPIELIEMNDPDIKGSFSPKDQKIILQPGLGEVMTLRTMIHEMTHAMLHTDSKARFGDSTYRRQEFEAESVAYIVSKHLGIDTSEYSFGYLSSWTQGGNSIESFEKSLETISVQAQTLINRLEQSLTKVYTLDAPENKFEKRLQEARDKGKTQRAEPVITPQPVTEKAEQEESPKANRLHRNL